MCDFAFQPVLDGFAGLQRGDHVAWKHSSAADRVFYHHAVVEGTSVEDNYVNVIALTKEGVGRCVIDTSEGLHKVDVVSQPAAPVDPGMVQKTTSMITSVFSSSSPTLQTPKPGEKLDREAVYSNAKAMLGRKGYDPVKNNCETFAFECRFGVKQEEPVCCPMCQTTGHRTKHIFSQK